MRMRRLIIISLCLLPVLFLLYAFIESWSEEWMPQDPPLPFRWAAVMWFIRLALSPLIVYSLACKQDPHGMILLAYLFATALFWGFMIELFLMARSRMKPKIP